MFASIIVPLAALVHVATAGVVSGRIVENRLSRAHSTLFPRDGGGSTIPPIQNGQGKATHFDGWDGGNCAYQGWNPSEVGLQGIAIGAPIWDNSLHCGGCVEISYNGSPTQVAMIVDQCPECPAYHIDMFPDLFAKFAPLGQGIMQSTSGGSAQQGLNWWPIECPGSMGPLAIRVKEGTSEFWFSAQVRNTKDETATMEIQVNGQWQQMVRQSANYFDASAGIGAQSAAIRVTSVHGSQVTIENVPATGGTTVMGPSNYA